MKRAIREYRMPFLAIIGLVAAAIVVGGYILVHQRLRLPTDDFYSIQVELPTAQAITPGQGQTVAVAGVEVGEIGKVTLRDGRALVRLDIDRTKLPEVHTDATVLTRPKTPLQDMSVQLDPGTRGKPRLREDDVLPVDRALPNVNVDEVLSGLDADTRPYLQSLVKGFGDGTGGRGVDLRRFLEISRPTLKSTRALTAAIRARRGELKRVVHNLSLLTGRLGPQSADLARLVRSANGTFSALAAEDGSVRATLRELPPTLRAADTALSAARPLSEELAPTLDGLAPALGDLPGALRAAQRLAADTTPDVRSIRSLTTKGTPLATTLRRTLTSLDAALPDLRTGVGVLAYVANELAYNPQGKEEGFLFWLDWFAHNTNSMLSTRDGNGGWWRGQVIFSCSQVDLFGQIAPFLAPLASAGVCPK
jgi:phospholipid/cholesterol/gamma-HCH transport system substrate-binding protein